MKYCSPALLLSLLMGNFYSDSELAYADNIVRSSLLTEMIQKGADRLRSLTDFFTVHHVPFSLVTLNGKTLCIVRPCQKACTPAVKLLIAHYDCVPETCGVNDNAVACVQLAYLAEHLAKNNMNREACIVFTAGEELDAASISEQGSFALGLGLRHLSGTDVGAFIFDLCGIGDTLVISESGFFSREQAVSKTMQRLQEEAISCAKKACVPYALLPTAYSDNAGLLAAGIPAQLITVLPSAEARLYAEGLQRLAAGLPKSALTELIKSNVIETTQDTRLKKIIPATWKRMHQDDNDKAIIQSTAVCLVARYLRCLISG